MMKYIAAILMTLTAGFVFAQNGYEIKITVKPIKNQYVYLGHYYGKTLPIIDSVKLDANSTGVFKGSKKLGGGIYLIGFPDRSHNFEFVIDQSQKFSIIADTNKLQSVSFLNSPENVAFKDYQRFMNTNGKSMDSLLKLRSGSSETDSLRLTAQID